MRRYGKQSYGAIVRMTKLFDRMKEIAFGVHSLALSPLAAMWAKKWIMVHKYESHGIIYSIPEHGNSRSMKLPSS